MAPEVIKGQAALKSLHDRLHEEKTAGSHTCDLEGGREEGGSRWVVWWSEASFSIPLSVCVVGLKIKADWQENKEKKAGLQQDIAKVHHTPT